MIKSHTMPPVMHETSALLNLPLWSAAPFIILLLLIAILPLAAPRWWESLKNKTLVSVLLGLPVLILFLFIDIHPVIHTVEEFCSFVILLGALFTISGGIVLRGDLKGTPLVNTAFLSLGGVLANFIGTTGASMVLIRPLLKTNSERKFVKHIPIFFIFIVSNIGGCLTPLGDPPLFLGYLKGVPFFWTLSLLPEWLVAIALLLLIFFAVDSFYFWRKESYETIIQDITHQEPLSLKGRLNFLWLAGVIASVFLASPLREAAMLILTLSAFLTTSRSYRQENHFTFYAIKEVAILFAGIFATMIPALILLRTHAPSFHLGHPWQFFWLTGSLSSFLDNAPTYLTFFSLAQGLSQGGGNLVAGVSEAFLRAISLGAVFMGANSYIGNAPNFMVRTLCEEKGIRLPSFFGYMGIAALVLFPIYFLITFLFFLK